MERQNHELEAKLAARRAKKLKDNQRSSEEEAAQRFLEEQVGNLKKGPFHRGSAHHKCHLDFNKSLQLNALLPIITRN